jgi:hypothetical protein
MLPLHLLGFPSEEFGEPGLRGLDDLFIQRPYEGVGRRIIERLENPLAMLYPQILKIAKGFSPSWMMGRNGTMTSGTVACSSSGADFGFVMSAITKCDIPASSLTVSMKFFVSGLSKLKMIGT